MGNGNGVDFKVTKMEDKTRISYRRWAAIATYPLFLHMLRFLFKSDLHANLFVAGAS